MSLSASLQELQHLTTQQWLDRATRTLPKALSVVLVVAIAWQLVQLTWLLLDRGTRSETLASIVPAPAPVLQRDEFDIQALAGAHLFGVPQVQPQTVEDAPQTQMNLVLAGVLASEDPEKGLAIIGPSAESAKVRAVGSDVGGGARLHSVYIDRVILDRGGQLETLPLPKKPMTGFAINRPAPPPLPAPVPSGNQFTDTLRKLAQTNPQALAEVVRPQPVFANGEQRGYRVYPGRNRQQFAKLGLQPGDLVLSINGTPLDDPQRGYEIFNTLGSSDRATVTVERNGQTQELTLNTAQITLPDDTASGAPERPAPQKPGGSPLYTPLPE